MASTSSRSKKCESETVSCCCRQLLATIKESETVSCCCRQLLATIKESETVSCCCRQLLATIKESETVSKRPVMPRDIFDAAMKGDRDVLIERLGLQTKEQTEIQDSAPEKIRTGNQIVRSELQSATHFGDTVLHILVTKKHNELALMVFERDPSLLRTQNMMLETPLHCAAEVGNEEVIQMLIRREPSVVKDALHETNEKGDTAFHVALRYNFADICCKLMQLDSEIAYHVNKEMFSPFHIALDEKRDLVAKQMLRVDPILACTKLPNGMFPVHFAARKNNWSMVLYFMENFPDYAELVDYRGRNLFHFAAEEADKDYFFRELLDTCEDMTTRMNNATDCEGNTPLHIEAMKGHKETMRFIWSNMKNCNAETKTNNQGLTPYDVSTIQLCEENKDSKWKILPRIADYERTNGRKFSREWFWIIEPPPLSTLEDKWERTQVIGLGSVLITTVTFAAAFTIPGGYNQDHGTPVLERKYMFWAFILANTLAFIQGFMSLFALLIDVLPGIHLDTLKLASCFFLLAANSMLMTFGLGLYVTLAPVCLPISIIILVVTMVIGTPSLSHASAVYSRKTILAIYAFSLLFIFGLALLSLL